MDSIRNRNDLHRHARIKIHNTWAETKMQRLWKRTERENLMDSLNFDYDELTDILTIEGVRYSGQIFRSFGVFPRGELFMFLDRRDGVVEVRRVRSEQDLIISVKAVST